MSLSKRYIPPMGCPLVIKLVSRGVGRTGTAGDVPIRCFGVEDILLRDVLDALSRRSGTETVKPLFLRLDEEKFFLRPIAALAPKRAGEPGIDGALLSLSADVTLVRAEAVVDATSVESEPGIGEDHLRKPERVADRGAGLQARLGSVCWDSDTARAELGSSPTA